MLHDLITELRRLWHMLTTHGLYMTLLAGIDKLGRLITGRAPWRFTRITPQIILGGQPARHVLDDLARAGVTGVVNMRAEYNYAAEVGAANLHYIYLPTSDNTAPSLKHLAEGVQFIQTEIDAGGSVYVHCWEGLGRGPTMAAAYFVSQGDSVAEAWAKIREVRPFIRPTKLQIAQLEQFAETYEPAPTATPEVEVVEMPPENEPAPSL